MKTAENGLAFNSLQRRTQIIALYYVVLLLCIPVWWRMTSILQLPLALDRLDDLGLTVEDTVPDLGLAIPYTSEVRLIFSLMNERGAATWPAKEVIEEYITPHTDALSALHNFDVKSQISFISPLSFEPLSGEVPLDQARRFVNPAWKLDGTDTLHFVFFNPSSPLTLAESQGQTFLIPKFGAVYILPPLEKIEREQLKEPMLEAVRHLYTLLGAEAGIERAIGQRTDQNLKVAVHTLQAIRRLTIKQPGMRIGKDVQNDVNDAFSALQAANLSSTTPIDKFHASINALQHSDRAFFNPSMLSLLYFPQEHKYAVYMPLFGPVLVPVFLGAIRIFKEWQNKELKDEETPEKPDT